MIRLNLAVLLLLAPSCAMAASDSFWTAGEGSRSCGAYTAAKAGLPPTSNYKRTDNATGRVFLSEGNSFDQWIFGFIAALNFESSENDHATRPDITVDNAGVLTWVNNYCVANPTDTVVKSLMVFREKMQKRQP